MSISPPVTSGNTRVTALISPGRWLSSADRIAQAGNGKKFSWGCAGILFVLYSVLSIRLQQKMLTTGFDLGIFEQEVRSYSQGHAPTSGLKGPGFNLLGDHFSPITALIAPFYRIFPSSLTLLVVQAALLAVAAVPLSRWAHDIGGRQAALVVGFGYGASWGIASAVGFDFHEVCFAVPLLAFSVTALGRRRWRVAVLWALPLLLVKEDLGLTLAAIGGYVAWRGSYRLGAVTIAAGIGGTLLETFVLIPAFNPAGHYSYSGNLSGVGGQGGLAGLLHLPLDLVTPQTKVVTLVLLLAPTAFMAVRSSLLALAVPTLTWRFLSDNPAYWGTQFHYSAVLMPIVFAAFVHALERSVAGKPLRERRVVRTGLFAGACVTLALIPAFPLSQLATVDFWQTSPRIAAAHRLLDEIPSGASVAASNSLVPQLTNRCTVALFGTPNLQPTDWIIVDTDGDQAGFPVPAQEQARQVAAAYEAGYHTAAQDNGFLLLHRTA
ncbi:DUF2079 domain-containing protein [Kitasatospora sp. NPDC101176]|uniref:DUF2079 domain-containing protein n=1 Tax=Kitasatospora sp. NPDC101176 TaxID=3364099 RepID=UPI0037F3761B